MPEIANHMPTGIEVSLDARKYYKTFIIIS